MQVKCMQCGSFFNVSLEEINGMLNYTLLVCSGECLKNYLKPPAVRIYFDYWRRGPSRSALEDRFARWMIGNKIPFLFEPFTFDVGGTWYVPDFYIPTKGFIEIKGAPYPGALKKVRAFVNSYMPPLYLLHQRQLDRLIGRKQ